MTLDCRLNPDEWADPWWRLCNLYRAVSDDGHDFKFYPNDNQERLYRNLWFLNLILKARQQGFSTFIDLILLDQALFNANKTCGIIADTRENATKLFRNKIKYPYEHLPLGLRNDHRYLLLPMIVPGEKKPKTMDNLLRPLMADLTRLFAKGFQAVDAHGAGRTYRVLLLNSRGDNPGKESLLA